MLVDDLDGRSRLASAGWALQRVWGLRFSSKVGAVFSNVDGFVPQTRRVNLWIVR